MDNKTLLEWQIEAGADEAIGDAPVDQFRNQESGTGNQQKVDPARSANPRSPIPDSRRLADRCDSLEALEAAVRAFDGCALKKTAGKTVFGRGNPNAKVLVIGEAPGQQEDAQGIPFCGPSGQLLDRMIASIGLEGEVYISNTVYWRPPGNRLPTPEETALCLPFVEKMIALIGPRLLVLAGGAATTALLRMDLSVSRLRGKFYDYANPYLPGPLPVAVTYHPSYLLRQPGQKRLAWKDLLMIQEFLSGKGLYSG